MLWQCKVKHSSPKLITLADDKVVIEDEKKFEEYFLKEKRKYNCFKPLTENSEMSLNKELIEQRQEMIIEQEECVPAYIMPIKKFTYKDKNTKRSGNEENILIGKCSKLFSLLKFHPPKSQKEGWFKIGRSPAGLRGGADHQKLGAIEEKTTEKVNINATSWAAWCTDPEA